MGRGHGAGRRAAGGWGRHGRVQPSRPHRPQRQQLGRLPRPSAPQPPRPSAPSRPLPPTCTLSMMMTGMQPCSRESSMRAVQPWQGAGQRSGAWVSRRPGVSPAGAAAAAPARAAPWQRAPPGSQLLPPSTAPSPPAPAQPPAAAPAPAAAPQQQAAAAHLAGRRQAVDGAREVVAVGAVVLVPVRDEDLVLLLPVEPARRAVRGAVRKGRRDEKGRRGEKRHGGAAPALWACRRRRAEGAGAGQLGGQEGEQQALALAGAHFL